MSTPFTTLAFFARWAVVLSLWVLMISMAMGRFGIANFKELQKNRRELEVVVQDLELANHQRQEQLEALKNSEDAALRFVKQEFHVVAAGEKIYHLKPPQQEVFGRKDLGKSVFVRPILSDVPGPMAFKEETIRLPQRPNP